MGQVLASPAKERWIRAAGGMCFAVSAAGWMAGCQSPAEYRMEANEVADTIINEKQVDALGETEPFRIETPEDTLRRRLIEAQMLPISGPASIGTDQLEPIEHWPEDDYPERVPDDWDLLPPWEEGEPVELSLDEALQVGARNSRDYQDQKENVFRAALDLDLERNEFRNQYFGLMDGLLATDQSGGDSVTGLEGVGEVSVERRLKSGAVLAGSLGVDLVKLLSGDRSSSLGIFGDATVTIPLLRGAGRHIVTEPLTQAERDVVYAIWQFERFKRSFAVEVASEYLSVLQQQDQVENAEADYRSRIRSARSIRREADAGRRSGIEVDQALQAELSARNGWISARTGYEASLDSFKFTLGLPTDARIMLNREALDTLADAAREVLGDPEVREEGAPEGDLPADEEEPPALDEEEPSATEDDDEPVLAEAPVELDEPSQEGGGPFEMNEEEAIRLALERRLDLRTQQGQVYDAQRGVVVAADALQAGLNLVGNASAGEGRSIGTAGLSSGQLRPEHGAYSVGLGLDLPWERTAERNLYRDSYIRLEAAARDVQALEDQVKLSVRNGLRDLRLARESYRIQALAVELAERRVASTRMFLDAGRPGVQIRDVLEAQDDLLAAENALTEALVGYRVSELELQRDLGVLDVDEKGLWREYDVAEASDPVD